MAVASVKVAVIVPVFDTPSAFLSEALDSILAQTLDRSKFELQIFVYDDGSQLPETLSTLDNYAALGHMYAIQTLSMRRTCFGLR